MRKCGDPYHRVCNCSGDPRGHIGEAYRGFTGVPNYPEEPKPVVREPRLPPTRGEGMQRIINLFTDATTCRLDNRRIGWEVETLLYRQTSNCRMRRDDAPIRRDESQAIMCALRDRHGWTPVSDVNGMLMQVQTDEMERGGYRYLYELGWNNFELTTPTVEARFVDYLLSDTKEMLALLDGHSSENNHWAFLCKHDPHDGFENENTLMMPDERDRVWLDLDGPVLTVLGHIASVHVNIDLMSVYEGMQFIRKMNALARRMSWPHPKQVAVWERYIRESRAGYEADRYGFPPETLEEYFERLGQMKVRMNRKDGQLYRVENPASFSNTPNVDMDLFLRSVWWHSRLRVRGNKLTLEIRVIPRGSNDDLVRDVKLVLSELDII